MEEEKVKIRIMVEVGIFLRKIVSFLLGILESLLRDFSVLLLGYMGWKGWDVGGMLWFLMIRGF